MITEKSPEQLVQEDIIRQTLEAAVKRIEEQSGNSTYRQAWKKAIQAIMSLKPDVINKSRI